MHETQSVLIIVFVHASTNYTSDNFGGKALPVRWYPPPGVSWSYLERVGRGYLTRPDEDTYELGSEAQAKKRKAKNIIGSTYTDLSFEGFLLTLW